MGLPRCFSSRYTVSVATDHENPVRPVATPDWRVVGEQDL